MICMAYCILHIRHHIADLHGGSLDLFAAEPYDHQHDAVHDECHKRHHEHNHAIDKQVCLGQVAVGLFKPCLLTLLIAECAHHHHTRKILTRDQV